METKFLKKQQKRAFLGVKIAAVQRSPFSNSFAVTSSVPLDSVVYLFFGENFEKKVSP